MRHGIRGVLWPGCDLSLEECTSMVFSASNHLRCWISLQQGDVWVLDWDVPFTASATSSFLCDLYRHHRVTANSSANCPTSSQVCLRSTALHSNLRDCRFLFMLVPFRETAPSSVCHFKGSLQARRFIAHGFLGRDSRGGQCQGSHAFPVRPREGPRAAWASHPCAPGSLGLTIWDQGATP